MLRKWWAKFTDGDQTVRDTLLLGMCLLHTSAVETQIYETMMQQRATCPTPPAPEPEPADVAAR